jgi:hypothetical protein
MPNQRLGNLEDIVRRYQPNSLKRPLVAQLWPRIEHHAVDLVLAAKPKTEAQSRSWMTSVGHFLAWLVDLGMWEPESSEPIPFSLAYVEHHISQMGEAGFKATDTIRSQLKRVGVVYEPNLWPYAGIAKTRRDRQPPYTPKDQRALWATAERLWHEFGDPSVAAVVAAGFGAGLNTPDIRHVRGTDLHEESDGPTLRLVTHDCSRRVPIADAWADRVVSTCRAIDRGRLIGPVDPTTRNVTARVVSQVARKSPHRLNISRMRTTWLVDRLTAQVPPKVLLQHAGLSSISPIERALEFVPDVAPHEASLLMRRSVT